MIQVTRWTNFSSSVQMKRTIKKRTKHNTQLMNWSVMVKYVSWQGLIPLCKSDQKCGSLQPHSAPGCPYIPCHRSKTPMGLTSLDTVLKLGRIIETPEASTGVKLNTYPLVTKHHQKLGRYHLHQASNDHVRIYQTWHVGGVSKSLSITIAWGVIIFLIKLNKTCHNIWRKKHDFRWDKATWW